MRKETKAEEKTGTGATGPPKKHTVPSPRDLSRCKDCHYPAVGFICWSPDGTCLRSEEERLDALERRRRK